MSNSQTLLDIDPASLPEEKPDTRPPELIAAEKESNRLRDQWHECNDAIFEQRRAQERARRNHDRRAYDVAVEREAALVEKLEKVIEPEFRAMRIRYVKLANIWRNQELQKEFRAIREAQELREHDARERQHRELQAKLRKLGIEK